MCATEEVNGLTSDLPQYDLKPKFPNEHQEIGLRKKITQHLSSFFKFSLPQVNIKLFFL